MKPLTEFESMCVEVLARFGETETKTCRTVDINHDHKVATLNLNDQDKLTFGLCPPYSNRGKYVVNAFTGIGDYWVDYKDMFPRYYFTERALVEEIKAWVDTRKRLSPKNQATGDRSGD